MAIVRIQCFNFGSRRDVTGQSVMNRKQRDHFGSMERKRDTTRQRDDVGRRRVDSGDGKGWRRR
jgi:hypothetical protein